MKWVCKGHELDSVGARIAKTTKFAILGAGRFVEESYIFLTGISASIVGLIDDAPEKQGTAYKGIPVYSAEEFFACWTEDIFIVVSSHDDYHEKARMQLEARGLEACKDFLPIGDLYSVYAFYSSGKLKTKRCTLRVTERCNLNCKHCSVFTPYIERPRHFSTTNMIGDIDLFFSAFDYVEKFFIIGGEPLLHDELDEIIRYLCEKYTGRVGVVRIITNGAVKISGKLQQALITYRHSISILLSDYTLFLPGLKPLVENFIHFLKENRIPYDSPLPEKWWFDFGFNTVRREGAADSQMTKFFDNCGTLCRLVENGKYFYCVQEGAAFRIGFIKGGGFDLSNFKPEDKAALLECSMGYSEKGYSELCRKCNGFPPMNKVYIPAAEQVSGSAGTLKAD